MTTDGKEVVVPEQPDENLQRLKSQFFGEAAVNLLTRKTPEENV